jgi:hypothetical protein
MKSVFYGLAALPLLAGVALAGQPMQLSDTQMDKVTAGWDVRISEVSNTSVTGISVYEPAPNSARAVVILDAASHTPPIGANIYLDIENPALSVASAFRQ